MSAVEKAAEVIHSCGVVPANARFEADRLDAADLLRPDWATDEAKAVLDAAVERRRVLYLMPPDDSSAFVEWARQQAQASAKYNLALDAYLASRQP